MDPTTLLHAVVTVWGQSTSSRDITDDDDSAAAPWEPAPSFSMTLTGSTSLVLRAAQRAFTRAHGRR